MGKSGSFFFYSSDHKFILKTMKNSERKVILDLVDDLINYYEVINNQSLIAKIYGVFTIKTNIFSTINVLIMQCTLKRHSLKYPCLTFDLKGSRIGRKTKLTENDNKFWMRGV